MITIETAVFTFDELSDRAKETAREWYRDGAFDYEWYDAVYEDAVEVARLMGIDIGTKHARTMGGTSVGSPAIYFSGFSSQGDGACFEGIYSYQKGSVAAVREYAPGDTELHAIVRGLYEVQRRHFYRLTARVEQVGHYMHEGCTEIVVDRNGEDFYTSGEHDADSDGDAVVELLRRFMRWIYRMLESEYDYQNADEQVDDSIRANEYTFTESGKRFG